jgi:hypothetical protein
MHYNVMQSVGVYKGQTVNVTRVRKPEVTLTRQDLVELSDVSVIQIFNSCLFVVRK